MPGASLDHYFICVMAIADATMLISPQPPGLAAISLGYGVVQLDVTIVNVAIDSIGCPFGDGISALHVTE